jgi:hypothetical protein
MILIDLGDIVHRRWPEPVSEHPRRRSFLITFVKMLYLLVLSPARQTREMEPETMM